MICFDRTSEAADAFGRATALTPITELCRRYPEVQKLLGRYEPGRAERNGLIRPIMISADTAISRVRRDITLGMLLKGLLMASVFASLAFAPPPMRCAAIVGIIAVWIALSVTSARSPFIARNSPALIASGQFDEDRTPDRVGHAGLHAVWAGQT